MCKYFKFNCHIIYQIEKEDWCSCWFLGASKHDASLSFLFGSTWETGKRIVTGNHIWKNVAWPVPGSPAITSCANLSYLQSLWALIKSNCHPIWAPDCVKCRAGESSASCRQLPLRSEKGKMGSPLGFPFQACQADELSSSLQKSSKV